MSRLDLGSVPSTGNYYAAEAFTEGALKYGRYNWRVAGVRASVYYAALLSHGAKWWNGQNHDPKTLVKELGSARACLDILIDAIECDMLNDDRPPSMPEGALEKLRNSPTVANLLGMYPPDREGAPQQFTILQTVAAMNVAAAAFEAEQSPQESPGQSPPLCAYWLDGVCEFDFDEDTCMCGLKEP